MDDSRRVERGLSGAPASRPAGATSGSADFVEIGPYQFDLRVRAAHVQFEFERRTQDGMSRLAGDLYSLEIDLRVRFDAAIVAERSPRLPSEARRAKEGPRVTASPRPEEPSDSPSTAEAGAPDPIQALLDYFNPTKTAQRIVDFARRGYGRGSFEGEDNEGNRSRFRDFILPFIERGYAEASSLLGPIFDAVKEGPMETLARVRKGFDAFVVGDDVAAAVSG